MRMFVHVGIYIEFGLAYWNLERRGLLDLLFDTQN